MATPTGVVRLMPKYLVDAISAYRAYQGKDWGVIVKLEKEVKAAREKALRAGYPVADLHRLIDV